MAVILQSSATRFIGDNIEKFEEGGSRAHRKELGPDVAERRDIFSRWLRNALGSGRYPLKTRVFGNRFFRSAGDETHIAPFQLARQGNQVYHDLTNKIRKLFNNDSTTRIVKTIEVLYVLSKHEGYHLLSSHSLVSSFKKAENERMDKIYA